MHLNHYISILFLFLTTLNSCLFVGPSVKGNGEIKETVREVEPFNAVYVTSGMNVYLIHGDRQQVRVVADANLHELIETKVENGTLEIKTLAGIWKAREKKVLVTAPGLQEITGTAGSNIYTDSLIKTSQIKIRGSAGSNLHLKLEGEQADISASAGANIFLDGSVRDILVRVSSGANIKAGGLQVQRSDAKASSGGSMWLSVNEELTANASSGGTIFYSGSPAQITKNSSSGGNIIQKK